MFHDIAVGIIECQIFLGTLMAAQTGWHLDFVFPLGDATRTAALVVAIVGDAGGMDVGRCAQNMMLAAWNDGVASCPNGIKDPEAAAHVCGGPVKSILSFGYPAKPRDPQSRSARAPL